MLCKRRVGLSSLRAPVDPSRSTLGRYSPFAWRNSNSIASRFSIACPISGLASSDTATDSFSEIAEAGPACRNVLAATRPMQETPARNLRFMISDMTKTLNSPGAPFPEIPLIDRAYAMNT
jgi:hypothetical protein